MRQTTTHRWVGRLLVAAAATLLMGTVGATASAQESSGLQFGRVDTAAFPEVTIEVSVPATLTGGAITADAVTLSEAGVPVPLTITPVPASGLEVVLLIDTSGSMNENNALASAKAAAGAFVTELPEEVAVGVVAFADTPSLVSPLTTDRAALLAAIDRLSAGGRTSLYDGIVFGGSLFSGSTSDRQLVALSDGGDTASVSDLDDAVLTTAGIRTSIIEIVTSESNSDALGRLAAGDGRLISITDPAALGALYQDVARSLVNRFQLAFTSMASGSTEYTLTVATAFGPLSASTTVVLPTAPSTTATSTTAAAVATPTSAGTSTAEPEATEREPEPLVVGTDASGTDGSGAALVVGAVAVGLSITLLLLAVAMGDPRRTGRRQLGLAGKRKRAPSASGPSIGDRVTALADDVVARSGKRAGLGAALDVADISMRPGEFVVVTVAVALTVGVVAWIGAGVVLAIVGVLAVLVGARALLTVRAQRRRAAFEQQLPDVLQLITNSLRSGFALPQALDAVANQAAEPARSEFQRVNFEARVGVDAADSLAAMADRMQSTSFRWVVAALDINRETGGELAKVLTNLSATIRERQALDRQIRTLTAEGRVSAYVLTALPLIAALGLALFNPGYYEPMRTAPGPAILVTCVLLVGVGWIWMRSMIKAEM